MALSDQQKIALDGLSFTDKALTLAYLLNHDNPTALASAIDDYLTAQYVNSDQPIDIGNMTSDEKALELLKIVRRLLVTKLALIRRDTVRAANQAAANEAYSDTITAWPDIQ